MAGSRGDVAIPKQGALIDVRINLRFGGLIPRIARPAHEMATGARRPITIESFDHQAARREIARNFRQCIGGRLGEQTTWRAVTVDRPTDKVVKTRIANIGKQSWDNAPSIDEHRPVLR